MIQAIKQNGPDSIHRYYMDIINCMPGIVYWIDTDCLLKGCNSHFVQLMHLTSLKDTKGTPYDQMLKQLPWPKEFIKSCKTQDINVLFSGTAEYDKEEPVFETTEGGSTYYRSSRVPLFDMDKKIMGLVVVLTDITVLKSLQHKGIKPTAPPQKNMKN